MIAEHPILRGKRERKKSDHSKLFLFFFQFFIFSHILYIWDNLPRVKGILGHKDIAKMEAKGIK